MNKNIKFELRCTPCINIGAGWVNAVSAELWCNINANWYVLNNPVRHLDIDGVVGYASVELLFIHDVAAHPGEMALIRCSDQYMAGESYRGVFLDIYDDQGAVTESNDIRGICEITEIVRNITSTVYDSIIFGKCTSVIAKIPITVRMKE